MTSEIIPGVGGHNKLLTPGLLDALEALDTPRMLAIYCYIRRAQQIHRAQPLLLLTQQTLIFRLIFVAKIALN